MTASDEDLIRRGDAIAAIRKSWTDDELILAINAIPAMQVAVKPDWLTNCAICGRVVDTRESSEGGDAHGCEYDDGWACSSECAEKLSPDQEWLTAQPSPDVARLEAEIAKLNDLCDCDCNDDDCVRCSHYPEILEQKRTALARVKGGAA